LRLGFLALVAMSSVWVATDGAKAASLKAIWGPAIHEGVSLFPTYRDLGIRIYEDRLPWQSIATRRPRHPRSPHDPAYSWPSEVTQAIAEAKRYHIQVALQIIGAPPWANGDKPWSWAPTNPKDYADFAIASFCGLGDLPPVLWTRWSAQVSSAREVSPVGRLI
jgi:hypothetical protein